MAILTHRVRTADSTRWRRLIGSISYGAGLLVLLLPTLFVFYWMFSLSLRNDADNLAYPPVFFPQQPSIKNYLYVFDRNPFFRYFINSLIVGIGSTSLSLLFGIPAAFGIARWKHQRLALAILVARLIPGLSYLIPWYILSRSVGLTDSYTTLILTHTVVGMPIVVWVMISFFEDIHPELEEAALVDGCGPFGSFLRIALPLTLPGISVAGILAFLPSWNNFVFSVILAGPQTRTLPVAVFNMMSYEQVNWGPLAAAALVVTLPVLVLTLFSQRYIMAGLTAGGVKG